MSTTRTLLDLYRTMRRIRTFEERVGEMFVRQATAGSMLHLSIGEEAVAGICAAMNDDDSFTTHHRGHGIFLARGGAPDRMLAEIGGKESGYCAGKGGSMHIADMGVGHLGANAVVGGGIPHAVGAALTYKTKGLDKVSVAFFGDGAMGQGLLYESMNMAALWSLPVLFVCINNQYGMGTRIDRAAANTDFAGRAIAFGLQGREVDGGDVEVVHQGAQAMIDAARSGNPSLLSLDCYRFYGHGRMDKSPYRDDAEEAQGRRRDPIINARETLVTRNEAGADELDLLDERVTAEMDAALDWALNQTPPAISAMFDHVYDADEPPPKPVRTKLAEILKEDRS